MNAVVDRHPLTVLLDRNHWTAASFLKRVSARHRASGGNAIATRKEKVSRWTSGQAVPRTTVQIAMADVFGVDRAEVHRRGWPDWLLLAFSDDDTILESPWTPLGTVKALDNVGGPVDRRGFLIASTSTLAAMLTQWAAAPSATASTSGRRIGQQVITLFDTRLDALRHLDDQVGSLQTYDAATAELRLITNILRDSSYTEVIGRDLYALAAEASRLAGWCAYDAGHNAEAERQFYAAMRSSASAGNDTIGAIILAFWANLRYAIGDPNGALGLVNGALASSHKINSPRVLAILHARQARAHSKAGEATAAYRAVDAALAIYDRAGPSAEDLPAMYWVSLGELHQVAGSAALSLGEPLRALQHFDAAVTSDDPYDTEKEARGTAIYLARRAEAHLALGDVDAALESAHQVLEHMGGVDSARGSSTLAELHGQLRAHEHIPAVQEFLGSTV
ncbi:tetratricopeptide repeat protein [Streptosporangium sp. NPDC049248]|uniref:tetratricopeptide repeat protein n=1 Tax=Streptosporangium sp. NPDC049248 TaxID=3155651 RepID=UPI0034330231